MSATTATKHNQDGATLIDNALRGKESLISRYNKPVAAVIPIEQYTAFRLWQEQQKERQSEED